MALSEPDSMQSNEAPVGWSRGRRRAFVALAVPVTVLVAVGAWFASGLIVDESRVRELPTSFFTDNRDELDRVRALVQNGELAVDGYYGPELPVDLRHLSATDRVSIYDDGSFFIPLWTGIPDDAGGIWWGPQSPEFRDMYGMSCVEPVDLVGDWWLCG